MTLLTLGAGGGLTTFASWLQQRWQRKAVTASRTTEIELDRDRRRTDRLWEACDAILEDVMGLRSTSQAANTETSPPDAVHGFTTRIIRNAAYLPEEPRTATVALAEMAWWSDLLQEDERVWPFIVDDCATAIEDIAAAVLRGESMPPLPDWYTTRQRAYVAATALDRETRLGGAPTAKLDPTS